MPGCPGRFGPGRLVGLIGLASFAGPVGMEGFGFLDDPESQGGKES